ncbi:hypothetical protein HW555_009365 [Spodoptera exigua]|uniref:BED-type domain-containing protein n=1 Tax=Spodoptera exigua TaxID=7107 RepID=A0A835GD91_SPOEX|nr:hypothetical protein HW555_009365 [Spodoptera exigua]
MNKDFEDITFTEFKGAYRGRELSAVWENFLRSENRLYALCKLCRKVLKCGSTVNLRYHLERTHDIKVNLSKKKSINKGDAENMEFSNIPHKRTRTKLSSVWQYYSRSSDKNYAQCKLCKNVLSCGGGTTSSLRKHLSSKHDIKSDDKREVYQFIEVGNDDSSSDYSE